MAQISTDLTYDIRHETFDPVPPPQERSQLSRDDEKRCRAHEAYQRRNLGGFHLRQLREAGCFGGEKATPLDLSPPFPLHPLFYVSCWEVDDPEDVGHGIPGKWDLWRNPRVKAGFLPCLYLASRILFHSIDEPWYDALLYGRREVIDPETIHDNCPLDDPFGNPVSTFHLRNQQGTQIANDRKLRLRSSGLENKLLFRIQYCNPTAGTMTGARHTRNVADFDANGSLIYTGGTITLSAEMLLPLLLGDLTDSEVLAQQFQVAKTILHEIMHATGAYARKLSNPPRERAEPFFEDEEITELGWSWENFCFGGSMHTLYQIRSEDFAHPYLGSICKKWPNFSWFRNGRWREIPGNSRYRHHDKFKDGAVTIKYPVPLLFYESLGQVDFWQTDVAKFGGDVLKAPKSIGIRTVKGGADPGADGKRRNINSYLPPAQPLDLASSPSEIQLWQEDQRRKIKSDGIEALLREQDLRDERRQANEIQQRQMLLHQIQEAVDQNDEPAQEHFLLEAKKMQRENQQYDDLIDILRLSGLPVIRVQAVLMASKLRNNYTVQERLAFAMEVEREASIAVQQEQDGLFDFWNLFLADAQGEVKLIQSEIEADAS